jgi:hypothetical protein
MLFEIFCAVQEVQRHNRRRTGKIFRVAQRAGALAHFSPPNEQKAGVPGSRTQASFSAPRHRHPPENRIAMAAALLCRTAHKLCVMTAFCRQEFERLHHKILKMLNILVAQALRNPRDADSASRKRGPVAHVSGHA